MIQISCQRVVFQQCFSLFLQNEIFVTVFHAVINIQVISVVKFDSNRNWFRKVQKKIIRQNYFPPNLSEECHLIETFRDCFLASFQSFRGQLISVTYIRRTARSSLDSNRVHMCLDQQQNAC